MRQNNDFDEKTNFIYKMFNFESLLEEIKTRFRNDKNFNAYFNYSLNRWFNYWSARAVETIFCSLNGVVPAKNEKDRLIDFSIAGINFDHKTSIFPNAFNQPLSFALENPRNLIIWLYENQSQQHRKHLKNRLFIVLHSSDRQHWKLKAEITWLKGLIEQYVSNFNVANLQHFSFEPGKETLADIMWAIK
jgi:hypothetical protein